MTGGRGEEQAEAGKEGGGGKVACSALLWASLQRGHQYGHTNVPRVAIWLDSLQPQCQQVGGFHLSDEGVATLLA
jgi:hypothetical protein